MHLFKVSALSAIETAIKLGAGFAVIKFIAMQVGPEGIACFGQFQNFIAAFIILISGSSTTGLVCFSAQEKAKSQPPRYLGNTVGLGLVVSLCLGLIVALFAKDISIFTFKTDHYAFVFCLLGLAGFFIMLYQSIIAQLNGIGELVKLITCKVTSSLILLVCSICLVYCYGLIGGLIGLICMQSLSSAIALSLLKKVKGFEWGWLRPRFNRVLYKDLAAYWLTSFVTLVSSPLILILVRMAVVDQLGWNAAGVWEASWKIAELYLLVITTGLTTYYVPKLSHAETLQAEIKTIKEVVMFGLAGASVMAVGVYLLRDLIIYLLFSSQFLEAASLLKYQLLGSIVKIVSWVLAYHMLVKRRIGIFLISELFFGLSFYGLSYYCLKQFGLVGLSYAYFINYCFYLAFCLMYIYASYSPRASLRRIKWKLSNP